MRDLTGWAVLCGLGVLLLGGILGISQHLRQPSATTVWPLVGWLGVLILGVIGFIYAFLRGNYGW